MIYCSQHSLIMHHPSSNETWYIVLKLISYASLLSNDTWSIVPKTHQLYITPPPSSSNDHGPIVSSRSKEHLLYCFIIYKSKHVQIKKKIFRWKYKKNLAGKLSFYYKVIFLLTCNWLIYFFKLRCV
jgi:hypothetical protein